VTGCVSVQHDEASCWAAGVGLAQVCDPCLGRGPETVDLREPDVSELAWDAL
jgi:hypothetical protein